jgi:ribonucleotide reductase beta subunit family protein with ferritin-like domain
MDPILSPREDRFTLFPIEFPDVFDFYRRATASFWVAQEIDLSQDRRDWATLKSEEQDFIKQVLAFFAASDGIVNENLCYRFATEAQPAEVRAFYGIQIGIETIHSEMYSLLIDTLVPDREEQHRLFHAVEHFPSVRKKAEWAMKWLQSDASFAQRLIAFACIEGIHFSGSFCAIFWMKNRNLLPGLSKSNEFIARDEGLHRDFACLLHGKLSEPCDEAMVTAIVREAVEIEKEFVTESLPVGMIGMNAGKMCTYIESVADHLMMTLGFAPIYGSKNPFPFMDQGGAEVKSNFFERRSSSYQKADNGSDFSFNEEF